MAHIIIFFVNLWRRVKNLWRQLWRRRVDYVRVTLTGALPEFADAPLRWQRLLLGAQAPLSIAELRKLFVIVAADPQAQGVLLRIDGLAGGWATLQSIRAEIDELRRRGKRVVAYLVTPDVAGFYVACAAETILMPPTAYWSVLGIHAEVQFLRDALAKWGIEVEATAVSAFKSAADQFVRDDFSPESREQFERLIDLRFAELLRAIADGRGLSIGTVRSLVDRAPLGPRATVAAGLVDRLCYEDEIDAALTQGDRKPIMLDADDARRALRLPLLRYRPKQIGLVRVEGTITRGSSRSLPLPLPLVGSTIAGAESVAQALRKAEQNPRIGAIVVYVNSGGGEVFASDYMWRELLRVRKKKPVVVAMGNAAASGGYYLATHASAIIAHPATVTGSIGVFTLRPVVAGLLEQAAIHTTVVSRGVNSGLLGGTQPPTESERSATRDLVFALYDDFLERVRDGRGLTDEQLAPIVGGRVWLGEEALKHGLVDALGGIPEALVKAQELAGLAPDRNAPLIPLRPGRSTLPPEPFPQTPEEMLRQVLNLVRLRVWAVLPFEVVSSRNH
jgi:protease-4